MVVRVALVAEDFHPLLGGIPEHLRHLQRELHRAGHHAVVITSHVPGYDGNDPLVERIGTSRLVYWNGAFDRITVGWGLSRRLEAVLRGGRFDLVHVHHALATTLGILAPRVALRLDIPVVGTFHTWFPRSFAYRLFRRPLQDLLRRFAAAIAVSRCVVQAMSRYFDAEWHVIPNGVDLEVFHPGGHQERPPTGPVLLFLGRLDPRNGVGTSLGAMPRVIARCPTTQLVVAGGGPLRQYYERRARRMGVDVRFLGQVYEERASLYRSADLYLCPTTRASFGLTLLEAMACGTPLIASDIPGFRELLSTERSGFLVPSDNPSCWAEAIGGLLGDADQRDNMRKRGLATAQRYAWPLVARQLLAVYHAVLTGGSTPCTRCT
jgi:phosphatidyl-myo-inositol alpha-mannosyltransferase